MPVKTLRAFETGQPWPPESELDRLNRYAQNRILWKASDDRLKLAMRGGTNPVTNTARQFVLGVHSLLTKVWVKAMFGEPPSWSAGKDEESAEHKKLADLTTRVSFNAVGRDVTQDISVFGDGIFRIGLEGGAATIEPQPPKHWFPVVAPNNVRRITAHVLANVVEEGATVAKKHYLHLEIHERGKITYRVHELLNLQDGKGKIGQKRSLTEFMPEITARDEVGDAGVEQTGIDDFLLHHVTKERLSDELYGTDDYLRIDSIVYGLEKRLDQIDKILDDHAEPFMYGPQLAMKQDPVTGRWYFDAQDKYIGVLDKDDMVPGYLTWDGKLEDALNQFNLLMEQFYLVSKTTPAAFGQLKAGLAESGSALKRLMLPVLQEAALNQQDLDPVMKRVLSIAGQLEGNDFGDISSQWRDGLPPDTLEDAQAVNYYMTSGTMSRWTAVKLQHPDWHDREVQAELDRIDDDAAAIAGSSGGLPPGAIDPTNGGGSDERTEQPANTG